MTKQEFIEKVDQALNLEQSVLVSTNILYNPAHVDYYSKYRIEEDYQWCYNFLIENKELLTIAYTPEQFKKVASLQLKAIRDSNRRMIGGYVRMVKKSRHK